MNVVSWDPSVTTAPSVVKFGLLMDWGETSGSSCENHDSFGTVPCHKSLQQNECEVHVNFHWRSNEVNGTFSYFFVATYLVFTPTYSQVNFPGGSDNKVSVYKCGRPGFNLWVGKIPWRRKWQPTPVLLPRKSHGRRSLVQATVHAVAKSWTRLSDFTYSQVLYLAL